MEPESTMLSESSCSQEPPAFSHMWHLGGEQGRHGTTKEAPEDVELEMGDEER